MNTYLLIILAFALVFILITVIFWITPPGHNKRLKSYVDILSVLSTLAIVITLLFSIQSNNHSQQTQQKQQLQQHSAELLQNSDKYWIDLEKLFMDNYPYASQLYSQLYPARNIVVPVLSVDNQEESELKQQHICQILYQIIENVLGIQKISPTSGYEWFNIFSSWSKSLIFRDNWNSSKYLYGKSTQLFIDGLLNDTISKQNVMLILSS